MNIEEIDEAMRIMMPEGLQYGRKTILQQKIEQREAQRYAFEKRLKSEDPTTQ